MRMRIASGKNELSSILNTSNRTQFQYRYRTPSSAMHTAAPTQNHVGVGSRSTPPGAGAGAFSAAGGFAASTVAGAFSGAAFAGSAAAGSVVSDGGSCKPSASLSAAPPASGSSPPPAVFCAPASTNPAVSTAATGAVANCHDNASTPAMKMAGSNVTSSCPYAVPLATPVTAPPVVARQRPTSALLPPAARRLANDGRATTRSLGGNGGIRSGRNFASTMTNPM